MAFRNLFKRYLSIILILFPGFIFAQSNLEREAEKLYRSDQFSEALPMYAQLIKKYSKSGKFQHRYGVCLIETDSDYVEARKHLKFARSQGIRLSDMYIAKSYYKEYQFDTAIKYYTKYLNSIRSDSPNYEWTKAEIEKSETLWDYLQRTEDIEIISSEVVSYTDFYKHYKLSEESGKILPYTSIFNNSDTSFIMYMNELEDRVCYPKVLNDTLDTDLFERGKLLDSWGTEERLSNNVNSEGDELYPYFLDDGVTLYFCSNGHKSMGGYDIFVTRYNPGTKEFMPPANLGMPFNSIGNDFLYVLDEFAGVAWFASDRNNKPGEITVYAFKPNAYKKTLNADRETLIKTARLLLDSDSLSGFTLQQDLPTDSDALVIIKDEPIFFVLNDTIIYKSTQQFVSESALELYKNGESSIKRLETLKQELETERTNYANTQNPEKRKALSQRIVKLEDEVFELDSHMEDPFQDARNKELQVLEASNWTLLKATNYDDFLDQEIGQSSEITEPVFLIPSLSNRYKMAFKPSEIKQLVEYDNELKQLYSNETSLKKALEIFQNADSIENSTTAFWRSLRKMDTAFVFSKSQTQLAKLTEENLLSSNQNELRTKLLKSTLIKDVAQNYLSNTTAVEHQMKMMDFIEIGSKNALQANFYLDSISFEDLTIEKFNEAINKADSSQFYFENALLHYIDEYHGILNNVDDSTQTKPLADTIKMVAKSTAVAPEEVTETEIPSQDSTAINYRVQIGIFSKPPAKSLTDQLPNIEAIKVDGVTHPKYYAGNYSTVSEAKDRAKEFDKIGFKGAFVVPFKDGKPISWSEARTLVNEE